MSTSALQFTAIKRYPVSLEWKQPPTRVKHVSHTTPATRRRHNSIDIHALARVALRQTAHLQVHYPSAHIPAKTTPHYNYFTTLITRYRNAKRLLLVDGLIVAVLFSGLSMAYLSWQQNKFTESHLAALTGVRIDESPVSQSEKNLYAVAASLPRVLSIPEAGINNARIMHLNLDKNGDVAAPSRLDDTGWFEASTKPGEPGVSFISGHVSGMSRSGVFGSLEQLNHSSEIRLQRGDGTWLTYTVETIEREKANAIDMSALISQDTAGKNYLVLMTCAGTFDTSARQYDSRLIVTALQKH